MAANPNCYVYIGNLDQKVSERVLYDILIQAGRVVDLRIPCDKETEKPKGYAFAQYETEEIADYAVKLFSGLVTLYHKTLKFSISGKNKPLTNPPISSPASRSSANRGFKTRYDDTKYDYNRRRTGVAITDSRLSRNSCHNSSRYYAPY